MIYEFAKFIVIVVGQAANDPNMTVVIIGIYAIFHFDSPLTISVGMTPDQNSSILGPAVSVTVSPLAALWLARWLAIT